MSPSQFVVRHDSARLASEGLALGGSCRESPPTASLTPRQRSPILSRCSPELPPSWVGSDVSQRLVPTFWSRTSRCAGNSPSLGGRESSDHFHPPHAEVQIIVDSHPSSDRSFSSSMDRRTFVKTASAAGVGLAVGPRVVAAQPPAERKRRYAIVGLGSRHAMYRYGDPRRLRQVRRTRRPVRHQPRPRRTVAQRGRREGRHRAGVRRGRLRPR